MDALIGFPGVLDAGGRARLLDDCDLETLLGELVDAGISAWERMRHDEGCHLKEAIAKHLEDLKHFLSQISNRWVLSRDLAFDAMKERVKKALEFGHLGGQSPRFIRDFRHGPGFSGQNRMGIGHDAAGHVLLPGFFP